MQKSLWNSLISTLFANIYPIDVLYKLTPIMCELVAMIVWSEPCSHQPWNGLSLSLAKNTIVKIIMSVIKLIVHNPMCKVSKPIPIKYCNCTLILIEWSVARCGSKNGHQLTWWWRTYSSSIDFHRPIHINHPWL